ncbi:MAG: VCBS repeat-containing protein [Verrucomicrobiota bacterium]
MAVSVVTKTMKDFSFHLKQILIFSLIGAGTFSSRGETNLSRFGFSGPEIFPIDNQIGQLHAADLDGDGRCDLILVNNSRSKINLLYNQSGQTNRALAPRVEFKRELNELPPGSRFKIDSIASEKRISSLVVADLNGDQRPDLAYYGDPKELVMQLNEGTNNWSAPKRWPILDGQFTANALVSGDLNGDKLPDLLLLGDSQIYVLFQKPDHSLSEPEKIPFTDVVKAIQVLDIDGDGRDDLLLVNWDSPNPFRFRLQNTEGQLGPEIHFALPAIRSYWADDLDADHKTEVITIAQNSGRAQVSNFTLKEAEPLNENLRQGQFEVLPLNKTSRARRGVVWADINGNHLPDLLVSEPDSGQLAVYYQNPDGSLQSLKRFPTLTGVSDLTVADWDGDGVPEIFLLSADERQVGVSRLDKNGRIPFPTILPVEGKPLAMAVGMVESQGKPTLVLVLEQENRRVLVTRTADNKTRTQKLSESFKSNPSSIAIHDVNQDGLADIVILVPYEKIKVLLQVPGKSFDEQDIVPPGGSVELPWLSAADVDGDGKSELLLAQKNFLRAVVLKSDTQNKGTVAKPAWSFIVKEQINGTASNSRIVGATPLSNGTNRVPLLFLLDAERKALTLCERDKAGVWQVVRNVFLPVTEFTELQSIGLKSTNANSIAFLGNNAVAWMKLGGKTWNFTELDGYETPIKDGRLNDVISGDLNNDGRKDLVFLETARNYVDLVMFEPPHQLVPANRWPVFEERTFRSRRNDVTEPREAVVVDVTGDGKNDLVVLVHDRILVYPQE